MRGHRTSLVRRWVHRAVAAWMLVLVTPGALELVEDVVHAVTHGDSLHDGLHDDQHCCSGAFHVCSCHGHARALPTPGAHPVVLGTQAYPARSAHPRPDSTGGPADGYLRDLIRPPVA